VFKKGEPNSIRLTTLAADFKALSKCKWAPKLDLNITFRTELAFLYYNAKVIPKIAPKMHSAWQLLQPWIVEAENRGARVQLVFLTKAKTYQCMYGENSMMDTEEEWACEFLDTLGFDGATFRPAPIKNGRRRNGVQRIQIAFIVGTCRLFCGCCCLCCGLLGPRCSHAKRRR
jgi:hypothetical protein